MLMKNLLAIALCCCFAPAVAHAEKRCGWLLNPTPRNWSMTDADGEWVIMVQGGYEAKGMDKISDMQEGEFVAMNYSHGYACYCLDVRTTDDGAIDEIFSSEHLPLAACRRDEALSEP
jgi:hypothetical protein